MIRIWSFLAALLLSLPAYATPPGTITQWNELCDWRSPTHCAAVDSNGAVSVTGSISASSSEHSTAAAPSYVEGTDNPLSGDLSGNLRVTNTTAIPAGTNIIGKVGIDQTTPGTTNGVQINAALPAGANVIGHVIADSGSTTVVTGNVTVVQPTASSLNATVVGTGTFATQSAITAASGSIASGAIASGAVASGAFASGAVSSGAYASGALASGAVVDLTNQQTPVTAGAATATKGILLGCRNQTTPDTATDAQQMAVGCDTRTNLKVGIWSANGTTGASVGTAADGAALSGSVRTQAILQGYNGSNADLIRSGDVNNVAAATGYLDALGVCRYNATLPTITDTRYNACQVGARGALNVQIMNADGTTGWAFATPADAQALAASAAPTRSVMMLYNGSTTDMAREAANGTNSTGTGITAAAAVAQCDDTSPTAITENQFGNVAMDCTNHSLITSQAGVGATSFTRPNDTTAYAANDAMSDSTSAPTSGGFTLTGACRKSGGIGMIQSVRFLMSTAAATSLQAEIWLFNQSVTNINDNAAFSVSDGNMANFVGKIPFTTSDSASNNASATVTNLNLSYTCTGTANLRYLVKVLNAYTPAAQEVLTVTPTYVYLN